MNKSSLSKKFIKSCVPPRVGFILNCDSKHAKKHHKISKGYS